MTHLAVEITMGRGSGDRDVLRHRSDYSVISSRYGCEGAGAYADAALLDRKSSEHRHRDAAPIHVDDRILGHHAADLVSVRRGVRKLDPIVGWSVRHRMHEDAVSRSHLRKVDAQAA